MSRKTSLLKTFTPLYLVLILVFMTCLVSFGGTNKASALSGNEFVAGRIMDDFVFFRNQPTMSISEIQSFLNAKVPSCDTWGTQPYGSTTRAAYAASRGVSTPFTCLKSYRETTVGGRTVEPGLCYGWGGGNMSAAEIIYHVSQSCGVNTKALIVLLQKEQSLITDDWPWSVQYRSATGYGCPDTAPCDAEYYGFFNQVYNAARQFKRYARDSNLYNYRSGRNNFIQYNPTASCGGSQIYIQNKATAGLYNYTPYQPNNAALSNLLGSGDSCSAYGNRNFWRLYREWFGTTYANDTDVPHPNGTLVTDGQKVYLIENSTRRHITSPSVFISYGYNWSSIKPASTGDKGLSLGFPISTLAPGTLFYSNNTPVYVMDYFASNALKKQHLSNYSFTQLGYTDADLLFVPPSDIPSATEPGIYTKLSHPSGTVILPFGVGRLYLVDKNKKRHIISPIAFESNYLRWNKIKGATQQDNLMQAGTTVDVRQGTILKSPDGISLVEYDSIGILRRPIGPWECYADRLGYRSSDWFTVQNWELPRRISFVFTC